MSLYVLLMFVLVYALAVATPGPAIAVCFSYVFFAGRARRHLSSPQSARWVQRATGAVMAGAAIAVATR